MGVFLGLYKVFGLNCGTRVGRPPDSGISSSQSGSSADDDAAKLAQLLPPVAADALLADAEASSVPIDRPEGLPAQMTKPCSNGPLDVEIADHLGDEQSDPASHGSSTPATATAQNLETAIGIFARRRPSRGVLVAGGSSLIVFRGCSLIFTLCFGFLPPALRVTALLPLVDLAVMWVVGAVGGLFGRNGIVEAGVRLAA